MSIHRCRSNYIQFEMKERMMYHDCRFMVVRVFFTNRVNKCLGVMQGCSCDLWWQPSMTCRK